MKRIGRAFAKAKAAGRAALVVFVEAGDPDLATTRRLLPALAESGADVLELGIPFSDPLADGPVDPARERARARVGDDAGCGPRAARGAARRRLRGAGRGLQLREPDPRDG